MPQKINTYIISICENVSPITINSINSYVIKAEDEYIAIKNLLLNFGYTNYNKIINILFDMSEYKLFNKDEVNNLSKKLINNFVENKLNYLDYNDVKVIDFFKTNIDDLIIVFYAFMNVDFIKIELIFL